MGEAREVAERYFDVSTGGDVGAISELLTEDCDFVTPVGSVPAAGVPAYLAAFVEALPDAAVEVETWVESADVVVAEGRYRGTHTGDLAGPQGTIPPTGRSIDIPFADVFRVRDGKVAAQHVYWDQMAFMAQLGLMPEQAGS
ncbi:MAG: ester cyclase [Actinobacteria bacterium]|nr:ester cyclase [Actinomycetota bacterium]